MRPARSAGRLRAGVSSGLAGIPCPGRAARRLAPPGQAGTPHDLRMRRALRLRTQSPRPQALAPARGTAAEPRRPGKRLAWLDAATAQALANLAERTADLQRLQAEYANYRKRVERDRMAVREQALANVLHELLPVLDDIGRAREHGELTGGFKSVGESLEGLVTKLGMTSFGEPGDPFDPTMHEALLHSYSADVTEPTAVQILQPGYRVGDRIIRPARVAVAEPGDEAPEVLDSGDEQADSGVGAGDDTGADDTAGNSEFRAGGSPPRAAVGADI